MILASYTKYRLGVIEKLLQPFEGYFENLSICSLSLLLDLLLGINVSIPLGKSPTFRKQQQQRLQQQQPINMLLL